MPHASRRLPALAVAVAMTAAVAAVPSAPTDLVGDPGPGYFATENVEWLGMIPFNSGSAGARVHEGRLYVTDQAGITIYDLSNPELPTPVSFTPSPQQYYFTEEDVDTNGEILVVGSFGELAPGSTPADTVFVYDVTTTPTATLLGSVTGVDADQHTMTCILDCTFVYGSSGVILDLTDPSSPTRVGDWRESDAAQSLEVTYAHDITEVSPGIALFSSDPNLLLADVTDPLNPVAIASGDFAYALAHGNLWPNGGTDDLMLVGGETGGNCNEQTAGEFTTYDARPVKDALGITPVLDEDGAIAPLDPAALRAAVDGLAADQLPRFVEQDVHRVATGVYTDGDSPYNQYCSHWFTTQPGWNNGGVVAAAWYEHGTQFLEVANDGTITEAGWFVPLGGSQSGAYWLDENTVVTTDYQRGVDILRFHGGVASSATADLILVGEAAGVAAGTVDPDQFFPWYGRESELPLPRSAFSPSGNYWCTLPVRG